MMVTGVSGEYLRIQKSEKYLIFQKRIIVREVKQLKGCTGEKCIIEEASVQ